MGLKGAVLGLFKKLTSRGGPAPETVTPRTEVIGDSEILTIESNVKAPTFQGLFGTTLGEAAAEALRDEIQDFFDQAAMGFESDEWEPLRPSTVKRKGHATIHVETEELREALEVRQVGPMSYSVGWFDDQPRKTDHPGDIDNMGELARLLSEPDYLYIESGGAEGRAGRDLLGPAYERYILKYGPGSPALHRKPTQIMEIAASDPDTEPSAKSRIVAGIKSAISFLGGRR